MYGAGGGLVRCFRASLSGCIKECDIHATNLDECTILLNLGEGAYTVIPVYVGGKVANRWHFHHSRMDESCSLLNIPNSNLFTNGGNESLFRSLFRSCWDQCNFTTARVRITFEENFMAKEDPEMLVAIEPWTPYDKSSSLYVDGVTTQTVSPSKYRLVPRAKHNGWIHERKAIAKGEDIYEVLLTEELEGTTYLLEGSGCNLIGLLNENTIVIPTEKVLIGIAMTVLKEAVSSTFTVIERSPSLKECLDMKELYLCSASRGIFPICQLNGKTVGNGKPGSYFKQLYNLYSTQLNSELINI